VGAAEHDLGQFGAMVADTVRAESAGLADRMAALPDAMSTIMVSPTARPRPSAMPAARPGPAAGTTTRTMVCQRAAPSAVEAST